MTGKRYLTTHPWLTFEVNLSKADVGFWMALGEAVSKCEHIAGVPLKPGIAKKLHHLYLAKGIQATTAIEGNTLTEEEVRGILERQLKLPPSREYQEQEVRNIEDACSLIGDTTISQGGVQLNMDFIKNLNGIVLKNLPQMDDAVPGVIRKHSVGVGSYRGAPPEDCEYLLDELCRWISGGYFVQGGMPPMAMAIIKAVVAHIYFEWIHPFGDGNGRTGRLLEFTLLLEGGVPTPAAHLLSNHYNLTRSEYYRQLDIASKSGGDILPFLKYAVNGLVDGLKEQLSRIRNQQWDIAWQNYIHEKFTGRHSLADERRRHLILDLSLKPTPIPMPELKHVSPRCAESYAGLSRRALTQDVNILGKMELLEKTPDGVRAKKGKILAFLPRKKNLA